MTKAERLAALKPHIETAGREWMAALDKACSEPSPYELASLEDATMRCDELEQLRQHAESTTDG